MIEQELGSLKQALTAFNKAIEVEPELEDVYLERANVLCELDRHEEAVQDYKKVWVCLLYTSPSPRDRTRSRMPSSA